MKAASVLLLTILVSTLAACHVAKLAAGVATAPSTPAVVSEIDLDEPEASQPAPEEFPALEPLPGADVATVEGGAR